MQEIWKDIKGYEGIYQVSNLGRVRSLDRIVNNRSYKGRIKVPSNSKGYKRVGLLYKRNVNYYSIHRLVAQAFIPNPNNYEIVNHKDENRGNNRVDNLEWCDSKYNNSYHNANIKRLLSRINYYMREQERYDIITKIEEIKKLL